MPRFPVRMDPDPPVLRILRGAGCGALCRDGRELRARRRLRLRRARGRLRAYAPGCCGGAAGAGARSRLRAGRRQVLPAFAPEAAVLLLRQQGPLRISGRPIMGAPVSSAGMEEAELCRLAACLHAGGTRTLGLGMSLGDLCMDEGFYPAVFAQLAETAVRLREKSGLTAKIFDLGGGLGVSCPAGLPGAGSFRLRRGPPGADVRTAGGPAGGAAVHESGAVPRRGRRRAGLPRAGGQAGADRSAGRQRGAVPAAGKARRISRGRRAPHRRTPAPSAAADHAGAGRALRQTGPAAAARGRPVVIRMLGADGRSFSCASERCPAYLLRADGTIEPIE